MKGMPMTHSRLPYPDPQLLASALLAYDESASTAEFSQNSYPCSICFSSVRGSKCVKLSCSHVFCRPCLQEYWGFCIAEGDVGRVACADEQCVKEGRQAEENEVRRVVSDDEVIRWKWLRAKKIMEKGMIAGILNTGWKITRCVCTARPYHIALPYPDVPGYGAQTAQRGRSDQRMG